MLTRDSFFRRYGLVIGAIALIVVNLLPTPEGLPIAARECWPSCCFR
jgi:hypothetical protein